MGQIFKSILGSKRSGYTGKGAVLKIWFLCLSLGAGQPKSSLANHLNFNAKHFEKSSFTCDVEVPDNFTHSTFGNTTTCQWLLEITLLVFVSVVCNLSMDDL